MAWWHCTRGLVAAGLVVAVAACSGSERGAETTTTGAAAPTTVVTTTPPTTTNPVASPLLDDPKAVVTDPKSVAHFTPQIEVLNAYVRAEQALLRARVDPVNPDDPALAATRTPEALANTQSGLKEMRQQGRAYRVPTVLRIRPTQMAVMGDKATVNVCYTLRAESYEPATGRVLDNDVFSMEIGAELRWTGAGWVLAGDQTWDDRTWQGSETCVGI
jgi:hypothetical protein